MNYQDLIQPIYTIILKSTYLLPDGIATAIETAYQKETEPIAKIQLETTLHHMKISEEREIPLCADTGFPVFFIRVGNDIFIEGGIPTVEAAISAAVQRATENGFLRPTVVDPLTRENPGNNIGSYMPQMEYKFDPDIDYMEISSAPKGGGTEVFGPAFRVLLHADGLQGIKKFVIDSLIVHGNRTGGTCPPNIIGIGIGGTADLAMRLSKYAAVLRKIGQRHPEERIADMELELLDALNMSGIGPLGMGGKTTALDVHIEYALGHLAGFSVGISLQCPAARIATLRIYPDGRIENRDWPDWFKRLGKEKQ